MNEFLDFIKRAIGLLTVIWVLFSFVIGVSMVPTDDMEPRMSHGDIVMYYRLSGVPRSRDVVLLQKNGTEYVGRVVAAGGDKVEITKDSVLMVNDNMVVEQNIFYSTPLYEGFVDYPLILEEDECFVLSDRREGGEDSRYFGPVKYEDIKGVLIGLFRRGNL